MNKILKAELLKLFNSRTFKAVIIASIVIAYLFPIIHILGEKQFNLQANGESIKANFIFFEIISTDVMAILMSMIVSESVAKEYSEGTMKNTLAYGVKRTKFYFAKYIANVIVMLIVMAIMSIGSTLLFTLIKGWGQQFEMSQLINMVRYFFGSAVIFAAMLAVIMFISTVVKSGGTTITLTVIIFILIPFILKVVSSLNISELVNKMYGVTLCYNFNIVKAVGSSNFEIIKASLIGFVWMVIALSAGAGLLKKQEIK